MSEEKVIEIRNRKYYSQYYVSQLQQENKQLKEEIEEYKRIEQEDLKAFNNYDSILTELEEWLEIKEEKETIGTFQDVLDKIQELKEKYK